MANPRQIRIPDDLWEAFGAAVKRHSPELDRSTVIRELIRQYVRDEDSRKPGLRLDSRKPGLRLVEIGLDPVGTPYTPYVGEDGSPHAVEKTG